MSSPKVSVLMPIFNTKTHVLKEAVESILSQTFTDFEFLIINDSPDNTKLDDTILSYKDERIVYIKNDKNLGLEGSTNKLIKMSKGEYLAIFDHDDISLPDRIKKEVEYLDSHPDVGVCSAQFQVFGRENWTSNNPCESNQIKEMLENVSCVSHSASMFRKSVIIENNILYEKPYFPAASYRIITRLALVTEFHNLPDVLLRYRMSDDNTSLIHEKTRTLLREKIAFEYSEDRKMLEIKRIFKFDDIQRIEGSLVHNQTRYYKAEKNDEYFFVKSGQYSYEDEFKFLQAVYEKDGIHFLKPFGFHKGKANHLVIQWCDGVSLSDCMNNSLSKEQKNTIIDDLCEILTVLRSLGIVHRDIIPRNFMVRDGRLLLLDFFWAVKFTSYSEYEHIKGDIRPLGLLGEDYAAGIYKWDDAFSFVKIAERISGNARADTRISSMAMHIGERSIVPDPSVFSETINKQSSVNDELRKKNNDLLKQVSDLWDQNNELAVRIDELRKKNNDLLKKNADIIESLSWRVTKPIRLLKRKIMIIVKKKRT